MSSLRACGFEVHGKVQGVFFRKCTAEKAKALGLVGWVENTPDGTVTGEIQGPTAKCDEMKHWLQNVGSPKSVIEKATFSNERDVQQQTFSKFEVRR